jgi:hypothetical protein
MKITIVFFLLCALITASGCKQKQVAPPQPAPVVKQDLSVKPFIPAPDSSITLKQLKNWVSCNPLLDSLAYRYGDSFKTDDPSKRLKYQDDFSKAQDRICVISGLTGGYKEYRWIMDNMGNPRNKTLLDSVHTTVF